MKIVRFVIFLIVLYFSLLGSALSAEQYVKGMLLDEKTREPINGAVISFLGGQGKHSSSSDSEGIFHIPLDSKVEGGNLARIFIEHPKYQSFDQYIGISSEEVRVILLKRHTQEAGVVIENVIFLQSSSSDRINYEVILRNNNNSALFLSDLIFRGKIRIGTSGITGFVHREKYAVLLDGKSESGISGKAQPNTDEVDQNKAWYPIKGTIEYEKNTHIGSTMISARVGMPFNLKIDPGDKVSVLVSITRKDLKLIEESGEEIASSMRGISIESELVFISDRGEETSYLLPNPYLMLWLTLDEKFPYAGFVAIFLQR